MSFSYRPLLVPAVALATAGAVALGPTVVAPPALTVAHSAVPAVQMHDVQLAGIGQDVYQFVTEWVQYGVDLVQYGVGLIPFIGGPLAAQIEIIYFDTIQPAVQDTVNYLASVVQNPFNLIGETASYLNQLYGLAYNFVAAELAFFGFPILPPLPPIAASVSPVALAAGVARRGAAAAVPSATVADLAEGFGAGEVVSVEIAAPAELEAALAPEAVAVPEVAEPEAPVVAPVPEPVVEPAVDPVTESVVEPVTVEPVTEPEVVAAPEVAAVVESDSVTEAEPVEVAAAPAAAAAGADRPARAVRGEARGTGKVARAGRSSGE